MRIRVRFGIRLGWPISNAAIFVVYCNESQYERGYELVDWLRTWLTGIGQDVLAKKIVFERSK